RRITHMKCQKCGINPATINMAMQMNDEKIQLHVCNDCFQDIQNEIQNQGFFQGDDMFSNPFFQGASHGQAEGRSRTRTKPKPKSVRWPMRRYGHQSSFPRCIKGTSSRSKSDKNKTKAKCRGKRRFN